MRAVRGMPKDYARNAERQKDLTPLLFPMPSNFLIEKGGKVRSIATGCDPSGPLADNVSKFVAELLETKKIDVQKKTNEAKKASEKKAASK